MNENPHISIPDRPELLLDGGKRLAPLFVDALKRWRSEMNNVFSKEANEGAYWPPEDPFRVFARYAERPVLLKELAFELAAVLLETEKNDGRFGDKTMYPHQKSQIAWTMMELLEGGNSYLIENAPGTGKTLVLGAIMQALTRLQIRNIMPGTIIYSTQRPFHLAQQTFSPEHRSMRLEQAPTEIDYNVEWDYLVKQLGDENLQRKKLLPKWKACREKSFRHPRNAAKELENFLQEAGKTGTAESVQSELLEMLLGHRDLIWDVTEEPMALRKEQPIGRAETEELYFSGDLGRGIPKEYLQSGQTVARRSLNMPGQSVEHSGNGENVKVLFTTVSSVLQRSNRAAILEILRRTQAVVVDDARVAATAFQDAIAEVKGSAEDPPVVFMASALSTTNGIVARPQADRFSLRLTIEEAMDQGVLPNVGVDMFPGNGAPLYNSGTQEALEQLIVAHFSDVELPPKIRQPQPRDCNTLLVVDGQSIDATVVRFRQEYAKQGIQAVVIGFRPNRDRKTAYGNKVSPFSERIFHWMRNGEGRPDGKEPPRVLVGTPEDFADALSLTSIQNLTIGTGKRISDKTLMRLFGRLQHSNLHREAGENFRGYFRQGLYQETRPEETIFHLLQHSVNIADKETLAWTPLQTLHGTKAAKRDAQRTRRMNKTNIPLTKEALSLRDKRQGRAHIPLPVRDVSNNGRPAHTLEERNTTWRSVAHSIMGLDRSSSMNSILETAFSLAPAFMRSDDTWPHWRNEFLSLMAKAHDPREMVTVVQERMERALKAGGASDRRAPIALPPPISGQEDAPPQDPVVKRNGHKPRRLSMKGLLSMEKAIRNALED